MRQLANLLPPDWVLRHHYHRRRGFLRVRADGDFYPLAERVQESDESIDGVALDSAPDEGRHLGLVDPEQLGGLDLGELPLGE